MKTRFVVSLVALAFATHLSLAAPATSAPAQAGLKLPDSALRDALPSPSPLLDCPQCSGRPFACERDGGIQQSTHFHQFTPSQQERS